MIDIKEIMSVLPHRYPFLLVDRIIEYEKGKKAVGIKNVTINENFFVGHFPGNPIMPGVLMVEAMAQVAGVLVLKSKENFEKKDVYFVAIKEVKFRKVVTPGDQLVIEVELVNCKRNIYFFKGVIKVEGKVVVEGEFAATTN